jgi:Rrf2 family protein
MTRVSRTELAAATNCPEEFLSKVLQVLSKAGLVTSHRGNTGGFELPRDRRNVSLLEVVEAVEGPLQLNLCMTSHQACWQQDFCPAHEVWAAAQRAMSSVLQGATIGSLAQKIGAGALVAAPVPAPPQS